MMKRMLLLMVITASIFSCQKEDNPVAPPYMDFKADGAFWELNNRSAVLTTSNLLISGGNGAGVSIGLSINNYSNLQTGTFTIGAGNFNTASVVDATGGYSAGNSGGSGTITIIENTGTLIRGSFEFTARDLSGKTKVVTEGRFMIYY
ncbi:MAG: DUF6252 family protein [Sphingobacteriales bacterium]|jgi:hypothetical protein